MGYPEYPNNRLIVNGVDLSEKFGVILLDGYTLTPPSPKTYTVDIPGGNGKLDLTESLIGDTVYDNRSHTFTFCVINPEDFERSKTAVSNFLHGKAFDYRITMDPGYIYHGRFTVSEYYHSIFANGKVGTFKIDIETNPFKMKEEQVLSVNAVGGVVLELPSGRMRVRPTIETDGYAKVIYDNKLVTLQQGTWTVNDLLFEEGTNVLYVNTYNIRNLTWGDLKDAFITWKHFKTKRIFEWYKTDIYFGEPGDEPIIDEVDTTEAESMVRNAYIKYEWGDL